jgi:hypothetical protein
LTKQKKRRMDILLEKRRFYKKFYKSIWVFSLLKMMRKMISSLHSLFIQRLMLYKLFMF